MGLSYKDAGVDIDTANKTVDLMKSHIHSTLTSNVLASVGNFGGLFQLDKEFNNPVLVASSDGVGTKLKLAYLTNKHDTVGQDLVNHCVNDILVQGAKPLFFLDYFGTSKLIPETAEQIVKGFAIACKENGCSLIGGETAELPGLYNEDEYDLAGFIVGVVEKDNLIDGSKIKKGDKIIGLKSNGIHTNGFSLVYKVLLERAKLRLEDYVPELGCLLKIELMKPHKSYLYPITETMKEFNINGLAHITGGGLLENIPRILPSNCAAVINMDSWETPAIFKLIQQKGSIDDNEMFRVFNMGIGMTVIVNSEHIDNILEKLNSIEGTEAVLIGEITEGNKNVMVN